MSIFIFLPTGWETENIFWGEVPQILRIGVLFPTSFCMSLAVFFDEYLLIMNTIILFMGLGFIINFHLTYHYLSTTSNHKQISITILTQNCHVYGLSVPRFFVVPIVQNVELNNLQVAWLQQHEISFYY